MSTAKIRHANIAGVPYDFAAGDEVLLVTLTNGVADATYDEINTAISDGKEVIVKDGYRFYYLTNLGPITFTQVTKHDTGGIIVNEWTVVSTNVWTNYSTVAVVVPTAPSNSGTYKLVATVEGSSAPSYSWVSDS